MKVNNPGKKDLDQLVMLEQETFSEAEAASRGVYRAKTEGAQRNFLGAQEGRTNNSRYKWYYY